MQNPYDPAAAIPVDLAYGLAQRPYNVRNTNTASLPSGNAGGITEAAFRPASVINLSNSNDVVIGPMTQYQGSVTIYQYMDATVDSTVRRGQLGLKSKNSSTKACPCLDVFKTDIKVWILLLIFLVISVGITVAIYLQFFRSGDTSNHQTRDILFGNEYEDQTIPNLGHGHLVIDRKQWGSTDTFAKNISFFPLKHPIPFVIITHIGVQSNPCDNVYNCSIKMRTIQDSAIAEKKLTDIPANFYVSNDGYVYVGRGWNVANAYSNKSLAIAFMGDYIRYKPTELQFDGVHHLIAHGVAKSYISPDYKLVAHNQTKFTKSPGSNVYEEIIKWPHWYPCGIGINPKCDIYDN